MRASLLPVPVGCPARPAAAAPVPGSRAVAACSAPGDPRPDPDHHRRAVTTDAVELLGRYGYTRDFPAERMMRDAKITQMYQGTNQIQRVVMARHVLDARR
jgi:hypothetical protein